MAATLRRKAEALIFELRTEIANECHNGALSV
jgi:hypothetical protein